MGRILDVSMNTPRPSSLLLVLLVVEGLATTIGVVLLLLLLVVAVLLPITSTLLAGYCAMERLATVVVLGPFVFCTTGIFDEVEG